MRGRQGLMRRRQGCVARNAPCSFARLACLHGTQAACTMPAQQRHRCPHQRSYMTMPARLPAFSHPILSRPAPAPAPGTTPCRWASAWRPAPPQSPRRQTARRWRQSCGAPRVGAGRRRRLSARPTPPAGASKSTAAWQCCVGMAPLTMARRLMPCHAHATPPPHGMPAAPWGLPCSGRAGTRLHPPHPVALTCRCAPGGG